MSRIRVEFRLTMPSRASWDGGWSGADRNYAIVRSMSAQEADRLLSEGGSWYHHWDDGWGALVKARIVPVGERLRKSDGFCGYDWMVRNILDHGDPYSAKPEGAMT